MFKAIGNFFHKINEKNEEFVRSQQNQNIAQQQHLCHKCNKCQQSCMCNQGQYPPPPQFQPEFNNTHSQNSFYNKTKLSMRSKYSEMVGRDSHFYSNFFDHYEQSNIDKKFYDVSRCELKSITIYHTDSMIVGIQCTYKVGFDTVTVCSRGTYQGYVNASTIELQFGEHIESISGRSGDSIDRLEIKTSQRKLEVGGQGGQPFKNILKERGFVTINNFGGSTRQFLDSLYIVFS
ncbi:jacalin-like lectin domain protein (macronuclear) [Tetrahymena thermophila SB210]|uniref:Jacalin-like lectin domain protein n=1 Tax=Tetrahymena thermophila (strain SB210) TaxID=312017 RepID=I7MMX5_TETTS|nr:jacalin-like lectin domain protein [Tetrahymena thermophila SB210]EAS07163.1 jacalin-like lectin domain protein [Tetrahymena thermophila SB210]|eukprot:XP_001027405.1 jacalin-like lectin domain protein [Tetrahymena thermophila SB210]